MPILPTSKKCSSSCSRENSLTCFTCCADFISLFGTKWSGTKTTLSLSKTFFTPILLNSFIATGPVISLARVISTFAVINCPAFTSFRPAWSAKIFSVIFIGFVIIKSSHKNYLNDIIK